MAGNKTRFKCSVWHYQLRCTTDLDFDPFQKMAHEVDVVAGPPSATPGLGQLWGPSNQAMCSSSL